MQSKKKLTLGMAEPDISIAMSCSNVYIGPEY